LKQDQFDSEGPSDLEKGRTRLFRLKLGNQEGLEKVENRRGLENRIHESLTLARAVSKKGERLERKLDRRFLV